MNIPRSYIGLAKFAAAHGIAFAAHGGARRNGRRTTYYVVDGGICNTLAEARAEVRNALAAKEA